MGNTLKLETLLRQGVEQHATDLHLTVGLPPQYRINEELVSTEFPRLNSEELKQLVYSILSQEEIKKFEQERVFVKSYSMSGLGLFRINLYFERGLIACAIRFIPHQIPSLESLGLPQIVKEFVSCHTGLIFVTGGVDSGKSTTLASLIGYINSSRRCHIITLENPIEYLHQHDLAIVHQREVNRDTFSFVKGLHEITSQDSDVVMISEMRDLDTIRSALILAETGHLVLTTLIAKDVVQAINKIIDVFPLDEQQGIRVRLSLVLIGIIVQELIPRIDKKGKVLATEIMRATPVISNLIRENNFHKIYSIIQSSEGMNTMNQSISDLYKRGLISAEEALSKSTNIKELHLLIKEIKDDTSAIRKAVKEEQHWARQFAVGIINDVIGFLKGYLGWLLKLWKNKNYLWFLFWLLFLAFILAVTISKVISFISDLAPETISFIKKLSKLIHKFYKF